MYMYMCIYMYIYVYVHVCKQLHTKSKCYNIIVKTISSFSD